MLSTNNFLPRSLGVALGMETDANGINIVTAPFVIKKDILCLSNINGIKMVRQFQVKRSFLKKAFQRAHLKKLYSIHNVIDLHFVTAFSFTLGVSTFKTD